MFCIQGRLTTLRAGLSGVQSRQGREDFQFKNFQTEFGVYPAFYSSDTGALSPGLGNRSVRQATHHHLALRLRTSGAIPPFRLCIFMKCVGTRVKDILLGKCKEFQ
jgi:hypothetical protein